jgi:hypothetical protein
MDPFYSDYQADLFPVQRDHSRKQKILYVFHVKGYLEHMYERSCSVRQSRDVVTLWDILAVDWIKPRMQQAALAYACDIGYPCVVSAKPVPLTHPRS